MGDLDIDFHELVDPPLDAVPTCSVEPVGYCKSEAFRILDPDLRFR
jgi:hypothetical protein